MDNVKITRIPPRNEDPAVGFIGEIAVHNSIKHQEEIKLNDFLKKFLVKKEAKEQELIKSNQFPEITRIDFKLVEDILVNRISLHKEGKQGCQDIINIIGEYANSNF